MGYYITTKTGIWVQRFFKGNNYSWWCIAERVKKFVLRYACLYRRVRQNLLIFRLGFPFLSVIFVIDFYSFLELWCMNIHPYLSSTIVHEFIHKQFLSYARYRCGTHLWKDVMCSTAWNWREKRTEIYIVEIKCW